MLTGCSLGECGGVGWSSIARKCAAHAGWMRSEREVGTSPISGVRQPRKATRRSSTKALVFCGRNVPTGAPKRAPEFVASAALDQDAYHAPQRLGRAPQQLIADRETAQIGRSQFELAQAAHGDAQRARH